MDSWLPFAPLSVRRSWTIDGLTFAANLTRAQFPSTSSQSKNSEIGEEKLQALAEVSPKLSESPSVVRKWFFHAKSTLTFRKGTLVKHLEINFNGECDRLKTWYQNHRKSNHRSCWASTVRSEGRYLHRAVPRRIITFIQLRQCQKRLGGAQLERFPFGGA